MLKRFIKLRFLRQKIKNRYVLTSPPYTYCKNCGNVLHGKYCSVCGQLAYTENRMLRDSVMSYLENTYSFDRRIGQTLLYLFIRPGFLTREFIKGRIASYVHPFKLYFFSSILLFGIVVGLSMEGSNEMSKPIVEKDSFNEYASLGNGDSLAIVKLNERIKELNVQQKGVASQSNRDSIEVLKKQLTEKLNVFLKQSDQEKSGEGSIKINVKTEDESSEFEESLKKNLTEISKKDFLNRLASYFSLSMLGLMPIFALLLWGFYYKKEGSYAPHLLLSVHLHSLLFILISIASMVNYFIPKFSLGVWPFLFWLAYFVLSLSKFYEQGILKSFAKSVLVFMIYFVVVLIVATGTLFMVISQ